MVAVTTKALECRDTTKTNSYASTTVSDAVNKVTKTAGTVRTKTSVTKMAKTAVTVTNTDGNDPFSVTSASEKTTLTPFGGNYFGNFA